MNARVGDGYDRRYCRTTDPLLALARLLDAARRESSIDAVAVADETGCLVAGAGPWQACEELAAHAPLWQAGSAPDGREVALLSIDGVAVLVCSAGNPDARALALGRAAAGCRRILGR